MIVTNRNASSYIMFRIDLIIRHLENIQQDVMVEVFIISCTDYCITRKKSIKKFLGTIQFTLAVTLQNFLELTELKI